MSESSGSEPSEKTSLVGLLLASGRGLRFDGGRQNKLLARLPNGSTVIRQAAEHLCAVLDQVIVVVRDDTLELEALHRTLHGLPLRMVPNPRASEGMGTSIAMGVAASRQNFAHPAGWLIAMADMPLIQPTTIRRVSDALLHPIDHSASIVAPVFQGQRGHPVGFSSVHEAELLALQGDQGARDLLQRHLVCLMETLDSGILRDIDTLDDLDAQT